MLEIFKRYTYRDDVEESFTEEYLYFCDFLKTVDNEDEFNSPNFSNVLSKNDLDNVFPNMSIAFRIFSTLTIANCSLERE